MNHFDLLPNEILLWIFSFVSCADCDNLKIVCQKFYHLISKNIRPILTNPMMTLEGHQDTVTSVAVFKNGKKAISASNDKTLKIWDLETGQRSRCLSTLTGHTDYIRSVSLFSNEKKAISASVDRTLKIWDLETGQRSICLFTLIGHTDLVRSVSLFSNEKKVISASVDNTLKI